MEVQYESHYFNDVVSIKADYSFTDTRKKNSASATDSTFDRQLILLPQHLFHLLLSFHFDPVTIGVNHVITGARYTTEDNSKALQAFRITSANIGVRHQLGSWRFHTMLEANNLFNQQYEALPFYPMPGRTWRLILGIEY